MKNTSTKLKRKYPERASDVFVTQKMLYGVRDELKDFIKSEIHGVNAKFPKLRSEIHGLRSDFEGLRSEMHGLRSDFEGLRSEVHGLRSDFEDLRSEFQGLRSEFYELKSEVKALSSQVHRLTVLIEEQNARNIIVLDGLTNLFTRQGRLEGQFIELQRGK